MRLGFLALRFLSLLLLSPAACSKGPESDAFCRDYKTVFLSTCTDTCKRKANGADACGPQCAGLLPQDATFKTKCASLASATTP